MKQAIFKLFVICIISFPALPLPAQMTLGGSGSISVNPVNPIIIGEINDDDDANAALSGASSIYISGKYAYVTSEEGVEIVDISDPSNPTHTGSIFEDETTALRGATSIYVAGKYAYATANLDRGVEIIDISDPSNPKHVSSILDSLDTELNGAQSIMVSGKYAYIASLNDSGIEIIDISDPATPIHVGSFVDDVSTSLEGPKSIYISGKYAYIADFIGNAVTILDISNPAKPVHVGAILDANSDARLENPSSIYVSGKYAYVVVNNGVEILDISNPESPQHVSSISSSEAPTLYSALAIYVSGKYAYIAASFGVEVLDVSDPEYPTHAGSISNINGQSIYVSGKYAYIASTTGSDGIKILDISGIDAPAASIGSIAACTLEVSENAQVGNNLQVNGGLNVGPNGISSAGPVSITRNGEDDDTNAILKLSRTNTDPESVLSQEMSFYGNSIETQNGSMYLNRYSSGHLFMVTGENTSSGGGNVSVGFNEFPSEIDARLFINGGIYTNAGILSAGDITVIGNITATGDCCAASDARLKKNVHLIDSALDKVNRLEGICFKWLDPDKYDDRKHLGVIAQETQKVFPEVVFTSQDEAQTLSVNYSGLIAPLIEAVKELSAEIKSLQNENRELLHRIETLETKEAM